MTEHTKLPWFFYELTANSRGEQDGCGYIRCETDNLEISHHGDMKRTRAENVANATFIVKACNAHEALVKALNDLHVWCEVEGCGDQAEIIKDAFKAAGITEYRCANCDGLGEWDEGPLPATSSAQVSPDYRHMVCSDCEGKGTIALPATEGHGK